MHNRDDEEGVAGVCDTGKRVVPGGEGGQNAEGASSADAAGVGVAAAVAQVTDAQHEEGHVQGEKEEEECDRRLQRAEE
jgi:hypothetical protein